MTITKDLIPLYKARWLVFEAASRYFYSLNYGQFTIYVNITILTMS